jgi:phage terminase small subunit
MENFPPAPKHLTPETRKWWNELVRRFDFEFHHLRILQAAAESWDTYQRAQRILEKQGLSYQDRRGVFHPRPEVAIARDARISFLRAMRELALSEEVEAPRPPQLGGYEHG